jgi:hypothetical protein
MIAPLYNYKTAIRVTAIIDVFIPVFEFNPALSIQLAVNEQCFPWRRQVRVHRIKEMRL